MSTLLVTGAGSLASAMVLALSQARSGIDAISIAARDTDRLCWLVRAARAWSALAGHPLDVRAHVIDWEDPESLSSILTNTRPRVVLHTASWQSAWTLGRFDAWSSLVRRIGYGLTLPLQLVLAARVGRVLAERLPSACFVNACFPDVVNPLLARSNVPVTCGIGNIAILAALFETELPESRAPLRLLAHHAHLATAISGRKPPVPIRAWRGTETIDAEAATWLSTTALPDDQRLNSITGASAVPLLRALIDPTSEYRGHAPGPLGLYGGYPIMVSEGQLALDLPSDLSLAEALAHERTASLGDGLSVRADGGVEWSPEAQSVVAGAHPEIRDVMLRILDAPDLEESARRVRQLRDRLAT